jgi:hypothetical protein
MKYEMGLANGNEKLFQEWLAVMTQILIYVEENSCNTKYKILMQI